MSYLSSQKVHGECKGRVSFSLSLELLPKSLSLMWMLCSSRTGLDDVLSCNAATGTAIVTSENFGKTQMFPPGLLSIYMGSLGKINPDQLLTHWWLHRFAPSQQQKNDDARWLPAASTAHRSDPEVSVTEACNYFNRKYDCLRYKNEQCLNCGRVSRCTRRIQALCSVDVRFNWNASSANVTTSFQTCAVVTAISFVGLLPATAN